jgi:hypothetical protein
MLLRGWGGGLHRTRAAESKILKYARRPSTFPSRAHRKFLRGPWPSGPRDFYSWNRLMLADGHLRASYRGQLSISHSQPAPRPGPSTRPLDQAPRPDPSNNRRSDSHSPQALFSLFSRAHLPSFLPPPPHRPAGPAPRWPSSTFYFALKMRGRIFAPPPSPNPIPIPPTEEPLPLPRQSHSSPHYSSPPSPTPNCSTFYPLQLPLQAGFTSYLYSATASLFQ